jgi:hypothetical protein
VATTPEPLVGRTGPAGEPIVTPRQPRSALNLPRVGIRMSTTLTMKVMGAAGAWGSAGRA